MAAPPVAVTMPSAGDPELDTMVNEVGSAPAAAPLEVDHPAEPAWNPTETIQAGSPAAAQTASATATMTAPVTLTEVVSDDELFNDPMTQVATLVAGKDQTIVVPVELGDASAGKRRFKLSVRLCLDPAGD